MMFLVAVAGPRSWAPAAGFLDGLRELSCPPALVGVGCCVGTDEAVIRAFPPSSLSIFCAWGRFGDGACSLSAVAAVSAAACGGARVRWWAGGPASAPLAQRLRARTLALVRAASVLVVAWAPGSRGSSLALAEARRCGIGVWLWPVTGVLPRGRWVAASVPGFFVDEGGVL